MNFPFESFVIRGQLKRHEIGDVIRIHLKGQEGTIKFRFVVAWFPISLRIVQGNKKGIVFLSKTQSIYIIHVALQPVFGPKSRNAWYGLFDGRGQYDHQSKEQTETKKNSHVLYSHIVFAQGIVQGRF